ncbi:MAG: DUF4159 domain-containing protein [Myxococcota bacterium]|nr:DUF4159 domain-containing protein [Myxococcota bacterium]
MSLRHQSLQLEDHFRRTSSHQDRRSNNSPKCVGIISRLRYFLWLALLGVVPSLANADDFDVQLEFLNYPTDANSIQKSGWERLAWEIRRRTSIETALTPMTLSPELRELYQYPFVIWAGQEGFNDIPPQWHRRLKTYLLQGGMIFIDGTYQGEAAKFVESARRSLQKLIPTTTWKRVSRQHVLYKSFYLVDTHGGRIQGKPYVDGLFIDNRIAALLYYNDLSGALARDAYGTWLREVDGSDNRREMAVRFGINTLMYALCSDYKEDQVHIPFILKRRQ